MVNRAARAPREDMAVKGLVVAGARAVSLVAEAVAVPAEAVVAVVPVAVAAAVAAADSGWLPITRIASIETGMKAPNL